MNLLLDTHAFLWFISGVERFSLSTKSTIADPSNRVFLSVASVWEIAIKCSLGKLELEGSFENLIPEQLALHKIELLGAQVRHFSELMKLPHHHRDPFDRLIMAQAKSEELVLVSCDGKMEMYEVDILW